MAIFSPTVQPAKKVFLIKFIPAVLWLGVILFLIWIPGDELPESEFLFKIDFDKFVHAGIFGLLAILFCWPFYELDMSRQKKIWYFIIITILTSAFGYGTELIQKYWAEGRSYDLMDWLADSAGVVGAFIFCRKVFARV
jgi:VanZ family protein